MPAAPAELPSFVLLLRGVNVGGHRRVPMADLRRVLTDLGAVDVQTYIQSGNAVIRSAEREDELTGRLRHGLEAAFGFPIELTLRTAAHWQGITSPYPPDKLSQIAFLDRVPDPERLAAFAALDFGPDTWTLIGRDLHLRYATSSHASRLSHSLIERRLGVSATARNLPTVQAIVRLLPD